jgi:hypothetical protein
VDVFRADTLTTLWTVRGQTQTASAASDDMDRDERSADDRGAPVL